MWAPASLLLLVACTPCEPLVSLADDTNYRFEGTLDIGVWPARALSDITLDWSALSTDLLGHPFDPVADVVTVAFAVFQNLTAAELEEALSTDSLEQSDVSLYVSVLPQDSTSVTLSEMTLLGNDIDVETWFEEGSGSWLLILSDTDAVGIGARSVALVEPLATSESTTVTLQDGATALTLDVDLTSLTPLRFPQGTTDVQLDWSDLGVNGRGAEWVEDMVDGVMLARFDTLTPEEIQGQFADAELLADDLTTLSFVGGDTVDLSAMEGWDGIDGDGTWALALTCSTCSNPAPPYFTLLEPCR